MATTEDPTAPIGTLEVTTPYHLAAGGSPVRSALFTFSGVDDANSKVYYHVRLDQSAGTITEGDIVHWEDTYFVEDLQPGEWHLHVRARSAGGWGDERDITFTVRAVTAEDLIGYANNMVIEVEGIDGGNDITFNQGQDTPNPMGGQLWSSNSPYVLLKEFRWDGDAAGGDFLHLGDQALETTRYAVTLFYGLDASLGYYPEGSAPDTEQIAGMSAASGGIALWVWIVIAVGLVLVVTAAVLAIVLPKLRKKEDAESEEDASTDPSEEEGWVADDAGWVAEDDDGAAWTEEGDVEFEQIEVVCHECTGAYSMPANTTEQLACPHCGTAAAAI